MLDGPPKHDLEGVIDRINRLTVPLKPSTSEFCLQMRRSRRTAWRISSFCGMARSTGFSLKREKYARLVSACRNSSRLLKQIPSAS